MGNSVNNPTGTIFALPRHPLDDARNQANAPLISADGAVVEVRVIPTDEEIVIARETLRLIGATKS